MPHDAAHPPVSATFVVVRGDEIVLQNCDGPDLPLPPAALALLERLTVPHPAPPEEVVALLASALEVAAGELSSVLEKLRSLGLLTQGSMSLGTPIEQVPTPRPEPTSQAMAVDVETIFTAVLPLVFRITRSGFEYVSHNGEHRLRLSAAALSAFAEFAQPASPDDVFLRHRAAWHQLALTRSEFDRALGELAGSGLLRDTEPRSDPAAWDARQRLQYFSIATTLQENIDRDLQRRTAEADAAPPSRQRVPVIPMDIPLLMGTMPLALGMVMAYAEAFDDGRLAEVYDFRRDWLAPIRPLVDPGGPQVFLFSNYLWSRNARLRRSSSVKKKNPQAVIIHGGPDTPAYPAEVREYFRAHPEVDVTVRGEGEATTAEVLAALAPFLARGAVDLDALLGVPGISFRQGDEVITTENRPRIADLETVPSPFLSGMFDCYAGIEGTSAIIETNRGCPYACTFCDWGSNTASRVRSFPLERVMAELEWCARNRVLRLFIADANFGILARDVDIANRLAELKEEYGFPVDCRASYAKNTTKYLKSIVARWVEAGIHTRGKISVQSFDAGTLSAVRRHNIKLDKYDELASQFSQANVPLSVELMLGLPGASNESFSNDLQEVVDREVPAYIWLTQLLPNSPMNDPDYRERFGIRTEAIRVGSGPLLTDTVVATSSYTRDEFVEMLRLRKAFFICENVGILRHVSRFVRQETGTPEMRFYRRLLDDVSRHPQQWPYIRFALEWAADCFVPPVSWSLFIDEMSRYLTDVVGLADDSALRTVLAVQQAVVPAPVRPLPEVVHLEHDYARWFAALCEVKESGSAGDWTTHVPDLRAFPAAEFRVDDTFGIGGTVIGQDCDSPPLHDCDLTSPVARRVSNVMAAASPA